MTDSGCRITVNYKTTNNVQRTAKGNPEETNGQKNREYPATAGSGRTN